MSPVMMLWTAPPPARKCQRSKGPRYYQVNAVNAAIEAIAKDQDRILLVDPLPDRTTAKHDRAASPEREMQ